MLLTSLDIHLYTQLAYFGFLKSQFYIDILFTVMQYWCLSLECTKIMKYNETAMITFELHKIWSFAVMKNAHPIFVDSSIDRKISKYRHYIQLLLIAYNDET